MKKKKFNYVGKLDKEVYATKSSCGAISSLRLISGLSWAQLGDLFSVSEKEVCLWVSGKPMEDAHGEKLHLVLAVVHKADRGSARKNLAMLMENHDGILPFDLLSRGEYERCLDLVGTGSGRPERRLLPLSPEEQGRRKPQPPEELVGALQDRVHRDPGRARAARIVRPKRSEKSV